MQRRTLKRRRKHRQRGGAGRRGPFAWQGPPKAKVEQQQHGPPDKETKDDTPGMTTAKAAARERGSRAAAKPSHLLRVPPRPWPPPLISESPGPHTAKIAAADTQKTAVATKLQARWQGKERAEKGQGGQGGEGEGRYKTPSSVAGKEREEKGQEEEVGG